MELPKALKAIIFDLDGTLFHLDIDWLELKSRLKSIFGLDDVWIATIDQQLNLSDSLKAKAMIEIAEQEGVNKGFALAGATDLMNQLAANYRLAIVSRNFRSTIAAACQKAGFPECVIVGREDVENLKPHPEELELALKRLGVKANQAMMVGDTSHDIQSAQALGMPVVIVRNQWEETPSDAAMYINQPRDLLGHL